MLYQRHSNGSWCPRQSDSPYNTEFMASWVTSAKQQLMCLSWKLQSKPNMYRTYEPCATTHSHTSWASNTLINCLFCHLETPGLETGPLLPQHHKSGTVCCPISDNVGCHTASLGSYWRHFYSDSEATTQCKPFLTAPNRNTLTYPVLRCCAVWCRI